MTKQGLPSAMPNPLLPTQPFALSQDNLDPFRSARNLFHIPPSAADPSRPSIYLTGNSLGCQPKSTRALIEQDLDDWANLGVDAHLNGRDPWLPYHEWFRSPAARLVGALPGECVMMNGLTTNLHLLMVSFYRPTTDRFKILIEDSAFPSDSYAVASQLRFHGFDPATDLIRLRPREDEHTLRTEDIERTLEREGKSIALLLLGAVNYLTGQWFDMPRITSAARRMGITVGWDLAHAAGNVPMQLHDWGVDFAAWCSYKYLNSGPGAVAGAFVHERHHKDQTLPRFAGWWGNDPATRFKMGPDFIPVASADAWQLSNPPIFALAPVKASMQIFDQFGMPALREKSLTLTAYLEILLDTHCKDKVTILTPRDPAARGAQLSLAVKGATRDLERRLHAQGLVVDFREPNVIRVAPTPLYNTFHDCWQFVQVLKTSLS